MLVSALLWYLSLVARMVSSVELRFSLCCTVSYSYAIADALKNVTNTADNFPISQSPRQRIE